MCCFRLCGLTPTGLVVVTQNVQGLLIPGTMSVTTHQRKLEITYHHVIMIISAAVVAL